MICKNPYCKHGSVCPSTQILSTREEFEAALKVANDHIEGALRWNKPIDPCYDSARRKILRGLANLPLALTRQEQDRLFEIEREAQELTSTLKACGVPPCPQGERTIPYYTRMFRGMCLNGMFRGRQ